MKENWIIPCNMKHYDVVKHFENNETIVWCRVSAINKGDIAYIYVSAPYSQILFRCFVVSDNVDRSIVEDNSYAIRNDKSRSRYLQLKLECKYKEGSLTLAKLREYGLGQTQIQARTDRRVQALLDEVNESE